MKQGAATDLRERGVAMLERVTAESQRAVGDDGARRVRAALLTALLLRDRALVDDHDPRYLHPARTIRILIADAGCADADVLTAAPFVDSIDPDLVPAIEALSDDGARAVLRALPEPGVPPDGLIEELVIAPVGAAVLAIVERLDQVRHLHLRPDLPWRDIHDEVRAAWIPAALRLCPFVGRRLERWADAFERRVLLRR